MECIICYEKFCKKKTVFSTLCGHIYHEVCLNNSIKSNPVCPTCRKPITINTCHQIYVDFEQAAYPNEKLLMAKIDSLGDELKRKDKKLEDMVSSFSEKLTMTMSSVEHQNEVFRKEIEEQREMSIAMEETRFANNKNIPADTKELLKVKDVMIKNLQKEVLDLKTQRAETTREMTKIQEQITLLKNAAKGDPKRSTLRDQIERSRAPLTMKLDNQNSKLVME